MLIRFIAKNLYSFKDETEFNLFPNKTQGLPHHKVKAGDFEFLRFSAIYGANGSGKSNLVKSISLLESLVEEGKLSSETDDLKFRLNHENTTLPVSLGIEFLSNNIPLYYSITFDADRILFEYLAQSNKDTDIIVFERNYDSGIQEIHFHEEYYKTDKERLFTEVLSEKLIQKNELLLTFLSTKYPDDFKLVRLAYDWFRNNLVIIKPDMKPGGIAHILDKDPFLKDFANRFIPSLNTGIAKIEVEKKNIEDFFGNNGEQRLKKKIIDDLKERPEKFTSLLNRETGEEVTITIENDEVVAKRLITQHQVPSGDFIDFNLGLESDGTKRLIDYIPAFQSILHNNNVYIIDEIERSIHPMTIKEIMTKLAMDEGIQGQLIFTTHESNLLDQSIFRPDEIWFAQKDTDGSSKLYSLSEYKIHNTINIENGYLKGRFGGIPFLGNLKELNW